MSIYTNGKITQVLEEIKIFQAVLDFTKVEPKEVAITEGGALWCSWGHVANNEYAFGDNLEHLLAEINHRAAIFGTCPECGEQTTNGRCVANCTVPQSDVAVTDDTVIVERN